jgi:hypothetical protein
MGVVMPISASSVRAALRRRWVVLCTAGALVAAVAGGTTAAMASTPAPPAAATAAVVTEAPSCAPHVGALLRALPRALKTDLKHLRTDAKADRRTDRAEIKRKALAGAYGAEIKRLATIAAGSHGRLGAALPPALKADLKTLRHEARGSDARKAEAATIWKKALAGDYGATFEAAAKAAQTRAQERCAGKAPASGS